jgi:hypothetical protein
MLEKQLYTHTRHHHKGVYNAKKIDDTANPPISGDETLDEVVLENWSSMKNYYWKRVVTDIINLRVYNGQIHEREIDNDSSDLWKRLRDYYAHIVQHAKVKVSVGCILEKKLKGQLRYYHSSANNASLFETTEVVKNTDDLKKLFIKVCQVDLRDWVALRRPSTNWKTRTITNVTFYIYKLDDTTRIGHAKNVDKYVLDNHHIICFDKDHKTGLPYEDNLCFFRCLAAFLKCVCKNKCFCHRKQLKKSDVLRVYGKYAASSNCTMDPKKYHGTSFEDLIGIENVFNIGIIVVDYQEDKSVVTKWLTKKKR